VRAAEQQCCGQEARPNAAEVEDSAFVLRVLPTSALDAFYHPFAYAAAA